jgi:hypothetical protein
MKARLREAAKTPRTETAIRAGPSIFDLQSLPPPPNPSPEYSQQIARMIDSELPWFRILEICG